MQRRIFQSPADILPVLLSSTLAANRQPPGTPAPRAGHHDLQVLTDSIRGGRARSANRRICSSPS
jgi:hypothetical protein